MATIKRTLLPVISEHNPQQLLAIYGPHFCGKSSLVKQILQEQSSCVSLDGDDHSDIMYLLAISEKSAVEFLQDKTCLFIKNAHKVPKIRSLLKVLATANRSFEQKRMIVITSAIDLKLNHDEDNLLAINIERMLDIDEQSLLFREISLWPFTLNELLADCSPDTYKPIIDQCLVKGLTPQVIANKDNTSSSLIDDLRFEARDKIDLLLHDIHLLAPQLSIIKFHELLLILAQKLGKQLDLEELANTLGLGRTLVEQYIAVLDRCLAIKICKSIHLSVKGELSDGVKVYFTDIAIRNHLIDEFRPIEERNEQEQHALFENLFYMERYKLHCLNRSNISLYYWRLASSFAAKEQTDSIDFVELGNGMRAYQCGYHDGVCKHFDTAGVFVKSYHNCSLHRVTMDNLLDSIHQLLSLMNGVNLKQCALVPPRTQRTLFLENSFPYQKADHFL